MTAVPSPPDDPLVVRAAAVRCGVAAGAVARWSTGLRACGARLAPAWRSADGRAALGEIERLAALGDAGRDALSTATAALSAYARALESAPNATHEEVRAASVRAAATLRDATSALGGRSATPALVSSTLAHRLPQWGAENARLRAIAAASALVRAATPAVVSTVLTGVRAWLGNRRFAAVLLARVGPEGFRDLLVRVYPPDHDRAVAHLVGPLYHRLGLLLAAGTADPSALPAGWLSRLAAGVDDTTTGDAEIWRLRRSLGRTLRTGRYGGAALDALVPPLLRAGADHGDLPLGSDPDDPLVGALRALATDPDSAVRLLGNRARIDRLLDRRWAEDAGRALGAALAASRLVRSGAAARLAEVVVSAVGGRSTIPTGAQSGLGQLLGGWIEDVNQGLITRAGTPATELDEAPPLVGPGPHARFAQRDLMQTLGFALRTSVGSAAVYAHQAAYAAALVTAPAGRRDPARSMGTLAENYGRLCELHAAALVAAARADNGAVADRLRNRATWIDLGAGAVGLVPLPQVGAVLGLVLGQVKGRGIAATAQWLQRRYHDRPIAADLTARLHEAGGLSAAEERQSKLYVQALGERARALGGGPPPRPVDLDRAFRAGQQDAARRLPSDGEVR